MSRYSVIFLTLAGVLAATEAAGQGRSATVRLSFGIPAVLRLQTVAGGGSMAPTVGTTEIDGAVVLRVTANCSWKLVMMPAGDGSALARAAVGGRSATAFQPVAPGAAVASGGRGRDIDVIVDYRLPAGVKPIDVRYELQLARS